MYGYYIVKCINQYTHYVWFGFSGQLKQHVEVVEEPIPVLEQRVNTDTWNDTRNVNPVLGPGGVIIQPAIRNDNTTNPELIRPGGQPEIQFNGFSFGDFYRPYINNHDFFCELWIAKCPLVRSFITVSIYRYTYI